MRLLIVGHTYVVAENQKKLAAIAAEPNVELAAIVPREWRDPLVGSLVAARPSAPRFRLTALPAIAIGHEQFYLYRTLDFGMPAFVPDVVLVEQGAGSLVYTQSLIAQRRWAPQAASVFFTWWNLPYQARWPLSAIERFNLRHSSAAVAGNADAASILRDHGFRRPLLVLPQLGVDPQTFRPLESRAAKRALGLSRFTVGFAGRLVEEKGIAVLLDALGRVAFEFDLLIVGDGPMRSAIEADAAARGWRDRVTFVTGATHDEMAAHLNCMDALVLPSLDRPFWKEQFGHVLIEAMACQVPVIGSTGGEIPRVIGEAGLVVKHGDADALASALTQLAGSAALRQRLGDAGRQRVIDTFTHQRLASELVAFLRSIVPVSR